MRIFPRAGKPPVRKFKTKVFLFDGQFLGRQLRFFNFSEVIWNPHCDSFHLSYLPTFSKVCKCVKNAFKSSATTTAARF